MTNRRYVVYADAYDSAEIVYAATPHAAARTVIERRTVNVSPYEVHVLDAADYTACRLMGVWDGAWGLWEAVDEPA